MRGKSFSQVPCIHKTMKRTCMVLDSSLNRGDNEERPTAALWERRRRSDYIHYLPKLKRNCTSCIVDNPIITRRLSF